MKSTSSLLREPGYAAPSGGNPKADLNTEAGAVENRLSLDPSAFPFTQDWEDGKSYPATIDGNAVTLTQISPGEFEVSEGESKAEDTGEVEETETPAPKGKSKNPAVAAMME